METARGDRGACFRWLREASLEQRPINLLPVANLRQLNPWARDPEFIGLIREFGLAQLAEGLGREAAAG